MWGIMAVTYLFSAFNTVIMGEIRSPLIAEFSLSEAQFLLLVNIFSYAYMLAQIPVGILLDKLGPKIISCMGNGTAIIGILCFGLGQNYEMLLIGRGLIGLGSSVSFLTVLKMCSIWFNEKMFCTMSGLTSFVGMMGSMMAQAPFAMLNSILPWRSIFLLLAAVFMGVWILILIFIRDHPEKRDKAVEIGQTTEKNISVVTAVFSVIRNKDTWTPLIAYGCFYGTYLLISGVYGSSMLATFYHCSSVQAAGYISVLVIGCAIGGVIISLLSDKLKNRRIIQFVFGIIFLLSFILLYFFVGNVNLSIICAIMFLMGFSSCAYYVCWPCVKECNHPNFVGISTSIANMGGYLGTILVPTVAGTAYSRTLETASEQNAFRSVILVAVVINAIGVFAAWFVKETKGENIWKRRAL